jgi:predicted TIM-barrel fold metal-dependent hydrolase
MSPVDNTQMVHTYDVHTHVGLDQAFYLRGWWPYAATAQDLLQHLRAQKIDRAVVFPFTVPSAYNPVAFADDHDIELLPNRVPFDRENKLLVQEVERIDTDGRLFPLAMFDPARCVEKQIRNLEPLLGKIHGLKVQATVIQAPVTALLEEGRPILDFAIENHLPMLFHTSIYQQDHWSQAADCLRIAEACPDLRFCLAHSLRYDDQSLRQAANLPNVWVDCSAHLVHCHLAQQNAPHVALKEKRFAADYSAPAKVLEAIYNLLPGRYLWGSDNPFMSWCDDTFRFVTTYHQEVEALRSLPQSIQYDMTSTATEAWLFGDNKNGST